MMRFSRFMLSLLLILAVALVANANPQRVTDFINTVHTKFYENQLIKGKWTVVLTEKYQNWAFDNTYHREVILKAPGHVVMEFNFYEDAQYKKPRMGGVGLYASTQFQGILPGLVLGMSVTDTDRFFGEPYEVEGDVRYYASGEDGMPDELQATFKNQKLYMIEFASYPSGGGNDEDAVDRLVRQFAEIKESL